MGERTVRWLPLMARDYAPDWWSAPCDHQVEGVLTSLGMTPKRSGAWFTCRCPLGSHTDRHPSFAVRPASGSWTCFSCGQHGSLPDLVMHLLGEDFRGAARWLRSNF